MLDAPRTNNQPHESAVLGVASAQNCMCSSRQIRRRLLTADLLTWLVIIAAAYAVWTFV